MIDFAARLHEGNAWLFIPSAILLGALHGLEPGHSKTMMAAFIIAIRGTMTQAVLLGLSATLSHTAVVWAVAIAGLYFGRNWNTATTEPYLQVGSAILIITVAIWMLWRTWQNQQAARHHDHPHGDSKQIDAGHGIVRLTLHEVGNVARFRLSREGNHGHVWAADQVSLETERADGTRQTFTFEPHADFVESRQEISEPHEFLVRISLGHAHHRHDYDVEFIEHDHHHVISDYEELDAAAPGYQDPHELAHANDIRHRFANREVSTSQIVLFGLTGGLIPCPASVTVLLLCLQLKEITLGATLVLCFSIGLAMTMVASGALAALSVRHVASRWRGFGELARKAPYFSGAVILLVGLYIGNQGLRALG